MQEIHLITEILQLQHIFMCILRRVNAILFKVPIQSIGTWNSIALIQPNKNPLPATLFLKDFLETRAITEGDEYLPTTPCQDTASCYSVST